MVWGVYGFTYTCANMIGTMCEVMETSPDIPRLIGTTVSGYVFPSNDGSIPAGVLNHP